jgi:hypothetical protein
MSLWHSSLAWRTSDVTYSIHESVATGQQLTVAGMKWLPHTSHSSILTTYAGSVAPEIARNAEAFDGGRPITRRSLGIGWRTAGSVSERGMVKGRS